MTASASVAAAARRRGGGTALLAVGGAAVLAGLLDMAGGPSVRGVVALAILTAPALLLGKPAGGRRETGPTVLWCVWLPAQVALARWAGHGPFLLWGLAFVAAAVVLAETLALDGKGGRRALVLAFGTTAALWVVVATLDPEAKAITDTLGEIRRQYVLVTAGPGTGPVPDCPAVIQLCDSWCDRWPGASETPAVRAFRDWLAAATANGKVVVQPVNFHNKALLQYAMELRVDGGGKSWSYSDPSAATWRDLTPEAPAVIPWRPHAGITLTLLADGKTGSRDVRWWPSGLHDDFYMFQTSDLDYECSAKVTFQGLPDRLPPSP